MSVKKANKMREMLDGLSEGIRNADKITDSVVADSLLKGLRDNTALGGKVIRDPLKEKVMLGVAGAGGLGLGGLGGAVLGGDNHSSNVALNQLEKDAGLKETVTEGAGKTGDKVVDYVRKNTKWGKKNLRDPAKEKLILGTGLATGAVGGAGATAAAMADSDKPKKKKKRGKEASVDLNKVAAVLDGLADYVDAIEGDRLSKTASERNEKLDKLAESYAEATGAALPTEIREKLANVEVGALEHLLKIANNNDGQPDSLGNPADINDTKIPQTVKEAAVKAEDDFLTWVLS